MGFSINRSLKTVIQAVVAVAPGDTALGQLHQAIFRIVNRLPFRSGNQVAVGIVAEG